MVAVISAEATAAAVAPVLDRLRVSIGRRIAEAAMPTLDIPAGAGPALPLLAMLRNLLTDRSAALEDVRHLWLYQAEPADASIALLADRGLVVVQEDRLALAAVGADLLRALYAVATEVVDDLWQGHEARLADLAPLVGRLVTAAAPTGGRGYAVVAPVWEPPGASAAVLVAERLTPLRFHRYDAHIAAWRAAGLTVAGIRALGPGPERDAVEAETNRSAAAPYEELDDGERLAVLAGLAALPN